MVSAKSQRTKPIVQSSAIRHPPSESDPESQGFNCVTLALTDEETFNGPSAVPRVYSMRLYLDCREDKKSSIFEKLNLSRRNEGKS